MIRYAVVGAGWISQIAFMPGTAQAENSTLAAIVTGNPEGARQLAAFYGIEHIYSYDQYDQMLADDVVDAVYIALPNSMHADYTIRAAQAGKHILVEKPLAVTAEECSAMIAAADAAGVYLGTAYRLHNEPGTLHALDLVREGKIGDPRAFTSLFSFVAEPDNHRLQALHWGGPLQDLGIYCLNAVRHLFADEPTLVSAMRNDSTDLRFSEVEESFAATLLFPSARVAQFIVSFGAERIDTVLLAGTEGSIAIEGAFDFQTPTRVTLTRPDEVEVKEFPHLDQFAGQTAYFSDCILTQTPPESDGREGMADMVTLLALERAALTGTPQPVELPARPCHPTADMARRFAPTTKRLMLD